MRIQGIFCFFPRPYAHLGLPSVLSLHQSGIYAPTRGTAADRHDTKGILDYQKKMGQEVYPGLGIWTGLPTPICSGVTPWAARTATSFSQAEITSLSWKGWNRSYSHARQELGYLSRLRDRPCKGAGGEGEDH